CGAGRAGGSVVSTEPRTRGTGAARSSTSPSGLRGSRAEARAALPRLARSSITLMASLDLTKPEFWDLGSVDKELRRIYDICSGCRRCLPLCPSFKVLFDRLDVDAVDGDVEKLPARDVKEVVDLCYQCKLCFNHCPYTPPHRWEVDFPRLMLRARATDARAN